MAIKVLSRIQCSDEILALVEKLGGVCSLARRAQDLFPNDETSRDEMSPRLAKELDQKGLWRTQAVLPWICNTHLMRVDICTQRDWSETPSSDRPAGYSYSDECPVQLGLLEVYVTREVQGAPWKVHSANLASAWVPQYGATLDLDDQAQENGSNNKLGSTRLRLLLEMEGLDQTGVRVLPRVRLYFDSKNVRTIAQFGESFAGDILDGPGIRQLRSFDSIQEFERHLEFGQDQPTKALPE